MGGHGKGLFTFLEFLRAAAPNEAVPHIRVVDVGASEDAYGEDVYAPLLRQRLCDVIGFEPNSEECTRLNARAGTQVPPESGCTLKFLPWALGDGSTGEFKLCSAPMTSSMLEPNTPLLRRFTQLEEVTTVVNRTESKTRRLDDLEGELGGRVDFLKLDVQGYERAVLEGSTKLLQHVLVVHTEVEFVEMYQQQPLFAEVDQFLRNAGYVFHRFASIQGRPMKPLCIVANPLQPISQQLWADAVYVRDMWDLKQHSREEMVRTALIMHEVYQSYDVVHHILAKVDSGLAQKYFDRLTGIQSPAS